MRPHFFLFRQKEIAAPGERKTGYLYLFCGRPAPTGKPRQDRSYVARDGRPRTRFRLHVVLGHLQPRSRFYGALAPRAPAAMNREGSRAETRLAALPRERPRSSRFAKPNVILRGGERYFDWRPIGRRSTFQGIVSSVDAEASAN